MWTTAPYGDTPKGQCHRISRVEPGGPAEAAGVKKGDRVVSVNGVAVAGESHEFALAAFGLSLDNEVSLVLEADQSPIGGSDALKPPVPLIERKSSQNLLDTQARQSNGTSPGKNAPRYERVVSPSRSPSRPLHATKHVVIQSNPSTGFIGMSLVQFGDNRIRVGGTSPKGPCASLDIKPGDIIVSIDGNSVHGKSLKYVVAVLTAERGVRLTVGLHAESAERFAELKDAETERQVWLQQGEAPSIGVQLAATKRGTRIFGFWEDEKFHAQHTALQLGDVIHKVNSNDTTGSSYDETIAAIVLTRAPIFTVMRDKTPLAHSDHDEKDLFGADSDGVGTKLVARDANTSLLMSPSRSNGSQNSVAKRGGNLKVVVLTRHETRGLGLQVCTAAGDAGARVESIIPGTPAEASGQIKIGDHILQANNMDLRDSSHEEVCFALALEPKIELLLEEDDSPLAGKAKGPPGVVRLSPLSPTGKSPKKRGRQKSKQEDEIKVVKIPVKEGMGLGLKIKTDEMKQVARISEVIKGKAASQAKNLCVGDRIISANGVYLVGRSHDEVIQAMLQKTEDDTVTLELMADKSPLYNPELRKKVVVKRKTKEGRLEGIGLKIHSAAQDYGVALGARISEVIEGGAAARTTNIKPGDWLIEANGTNLERLPHDEIVKVLKSLKTSKITFTLEEDDSPMDSEEQEEEPDAAHPEGPPPDQVYGDRSLLGNFREIVVPRNPADNLLGFHFYSDPYLPWSRVCDENLSETCYKLGMRPNDALVEIAGRDVLNEGHDFVFESLQGTKPVKIVVAEAPKDETPAMYQIGRGLVFPPMSVFVAQGAGVKLCQPRVHHLVVEGVDAGRPAAEEGVQPGDYLLAVLAPGVRTPPSTEVVAAALETSPEVRCVFGRRRPTRNVVLVRPDTIAMTGDSMFQRTWGFDVVQVPSDTTGHSDSAGAFMVARLDDLGSGAACGLRHADIVIAVGGVSVKSPEVLNNLLTEREVTVTVLEPASIPRPKVVLERPSKDVSFGFAVKSATHVPGAYVTQVLESSPADKAGLHPGLEIVTINGGPVGIRAHADVLALIKNAGTRLELEVAAELGDVDIGHRYLKAVQLRRGQAGLGMKIVTKEDNKSFPRISSVDKGGVAARSGVIDYGDRIISANGRSMAGVTSKDAVDILVSNELLTLELLSDSSEMYRVTKEYAGNAPPIADAVLRKDWYVGDAALADAKAYTAAGQYGSFLVRRKRADGSAYTLFIKDREGKVKMYGIKWNAHAAKYVFGERYPFNDLLHVVKSLRLSGIPAVDGKRLHLFDAALSYQDWYVMDTDTNEAAFVRHVAAAQPGQFLVRQRPRDKGNYLLCAKVAEPDKTVMLSCQWIEDRGMYEVSNHETHLFNIDSVTAFVEVGTEDGVDTDDGGKLRLTTAAVGYDPTALPPPAAPADASAAAKAQAPADASKAEPGACAAAADSNPSAAPAASGMSDLDRIAAELDAMPGIAGADSAAPPPASSMVDQLAAALAEARLAAAEAAAASEMATSAADFRATALLPDLPPEDSSDEDEDGEDEDLPPLPEESDDEDEDLPDLPQPQDSEEDEDLPDLPPGADDAESDEELPPLPAQHEVDLGGAGFGAHDDDTEV